MEIEKQKRNILFNIRNADLINNMLADKAKVKRTSKSSIVEELILDSYLPQNQAICQLIEDNLYQDNHVIEDLIVAIYEGIGGNVSKHYNIVPLIQFLIKNLIVYGNHIGNTENLSKCIPLYESILNIIEKDYKERNEKWLLIQLDLDKHMLSDLKEDPSKVRLSELYQLILDNWQLLKEMSITYIFLSRLAALHDWSNCDTCSNRLELLEIIRNVSGEC